MCISAEALFPIFGKLGEKKVKMNERLSHWKMSKIFSLFDDAAVASSILLPLQISNHYYVKNGKSLKKSSNYILSMEKNDMVG